MGYYSFREEISMKPDLKASSFPYLILGAGGLGFFLQRMLYATGTDEKGLLIRGHWAAVSLVILTALTLAAIFLAGRKASPSSNTPAASIPGAIGCLVGAAALFIQSTPPEIPDTIYKAEQAATLAAQLSLCVLAFCRFTGKKSPFGFCGILCLFLAIRMVGQYRIWCSVPQLMDYALFLLAHVALMIFAYQLAARDAGFGNPRSLLFWGLTSLYLCCCAPCARQDRIFLLMLGIWVFTALPRFLPETDSGDSNQTQEVSP